jgi:hypothetical protein
MKFTAAQDARLCTAGVYGAGAGGAGWMLAHGEYLAAAVFAFFSLGALYDFQRGYRRDLTAASRWRQQRWNALKALEQEYRAGVHANMPPTVAEFNARISAAKKRAAEEIAQRLGPLT